MHFNNRPLSAAPVVAIQYNSLCLRTDFMDEFSKEYSAYEPNLNYIRFS